MRLIALVFITILTTATLWAQSGGGKITGKDANILGQVNTITTSVPFLMIAPDSRAGAMGDAGVATTPDATSAHWNAAKFSFIDRDMGFSVSYTPWLRKLVSDINLAYLSGFKKIGNNQVFSASLLYFTLGDITFTDINGEELTTFNPNEFAVDFGYSRLLGEKLSGSISLRYIYSNLTGGQYVQGTASHPGQAGAADVGFYYQDDINLAERAAKLALGLNISNIGAKISYTENQDKDFIPINMRLGGALSMDIDEYNSFQLAADLNKLLVPTMPVYYEDGEVTEDGYTVQSGDEIIKYGKDPNPSVPVGMIQSFYDAPGVELDPENPDNRSIFREEMREITCSMGLEYWYINQFAIRGGYFYEHATKGNRKYFTIGLGLKYNVFALDFAYLIPTQQRNPLENTLRFTLSFDFEGLMKQEQNPN